MKAKGSSLSGYFFKALRARLNPILEYGGASNEKSKTPYPRLHTTFLYSFSTRFSSFPWSTAGERKTKKGREKKVREEKRENGKRERVTEMRHLGASGAKQRQTALVGEVNQ